MCQPIRRFAAPALCLLLGIFIATAITDAQAPENPGPHAAGWQTITFANPYSGSAQIPCLVVYPGLKAGQNAGLDRSGAPYPVIVFGHGFTANGQSQIQLGRHLASWGFIFVAHDTVPLGPQTSQVNDMSALVKILRDENLRPTSFVYQAVDRKNFAVAGHSMGGGSAAGVLGSSADVQAGLLLAPWVGLFPNASDWMKTARAPYQVLVGNGDVFAPPSSNASKFYQKGAGVRRYRGLTVLWNKCDHFAIHATDQNSTPDQVESFRLARRQSTAFLLAALADRHPYLDVLVGNGAHAESKFDQLTYEARHPDLYLTGVAKVGGSLDYHVMGRAGGADAVYFAPLPAQIVIPGLGTLGLHPALMFPLGAGVVGGQQTRHGSYPIPAVAQLKGVRIWVQAAASDAANQLVLSPTRDFTIQ